MKEEKKLPKGFKERAKFRWKGRTMVVATSKERLMVFYNGTKNVPEAWWQSPFFE